ncbi:OmpL47-type beta-barrel domain-containing protein [Gordonia sp. NPDC003424]
MAARSVTITLTNDIDAALVLTHWDLDHGVWGTNPPARIEPGTSATWEAESDGVATGTEGSVDFELDLGAGTTGRVHLFFDNPFVGSNSYDQSAPAAFSFTGPGGSDGNDSTFRLTLTDASTTGDGIPDDWKRNGVTIDPGDGSGPQFVDLPAMGATVDKADVFVHLDWMADATHSDAPTQAAIKLVVDAFANAPYISRNGAIGINLHVDAGPNSIMNFATNATWGGLSRAKNVGHVVQLGSSVNDSGNNVVTYDWTEFDKLKKRPGGYFSSGRAQIFRYAVAAHQLGSAANSGIARDIPTSDFIVSLGTFGAVNNTQYGGTFMHELGHALGLDHGGGDATNNKPNYVSVMNYLWQFFGVTRSGTTLLDYSNAALIALNEAALNETVGLGPGSAGVAIKHWVPATPAAPAGFVQVNDASQPIDWDGDGLTTKTNVAFDTNNDSSTGTLAPYDDWLHLRIKGGSVGGAGYSPPAVSNAVTVELTESMASVILPADTTPPVTTATLFPPPNSLGWNRTDVVVTLTATDDISGVARTEYTVDGLGPTHYVAPFTVSPEGVHDIDFGSIDRSQNKEEPKSVQVLIDKTAPEFAVFYDPVLDDILVTGRDELSGIDPGAQPPASRVDTEWTPFGSDTAELRRYRLTDNAGNSTTLIIKVRCSPTTYEASILGYVYDDETHRPPHQVAQDEIADDTRDAAALRSLGRVAQVYRQRNTLIFSRLTGRRDSTPLLGFTQIVALGAGESRMVTRARYDVLDDYTILSEERPALTCIPCGRRPDDGQRTPDDHATGRASDTSHQRRCAPEIVNERDTRGQVTLRVVSRDGGLAVEQ